MAMPEMAPSELADGGLTRGAGRRRGRRRCRARDFCGEDFSDGDGAGLGGADGGSGYHGAAVVGAPGRRGRQDPDGQAVAREDDGEGGEQVSREKKGQASGS